MNLFIASHIGSDIWITAIATLIAGIIGGTIGGRFTLRAQIQSSRDQRRRDLEIDQRDVKGTLQAIAAELSVLKSESVIALRQQLDDLLKRREEQHVSHLELPFIVPTVEKSHTVVFESNASVIGKIGDPSLTKEIVHVYGLISGLIDRLNATVPEFQNWRLASIHGGGKQMAAGLLKSLEDGIRNGMPRLERKIDDVIQRIEGYVNSQRTEL
jgi:hypothetical protein